MKTCEIVAKALAKLHETMHFEDEFAMIMEMLKILQVECGLEYKTAKFVLNDKDFVPETLDAFYALTGAK